MYITPIESNFSLPVRAADAMRRNAASARTAASLGVSRVEPVRADDGTGFKESAERDAMALLKQLLPFTGKGALINVFA